MSPDQFRDGVEVVRHYTSTGGELEGLPDHGPVVEVCIVHGEVQEDDPRPGADPEVSLHLRHHELRGRLVLLEDLRVAVPRVGADQAPVAALTVGNKLTIRNKTHDMEDDSNSSAVL